MSEDAVTRFTNQLKVWQGQGYYVLLKNFYNMPEKKMGFVVSADDEKQEFIYKLYINKELDERHYPYAQVDELIAEIDKIIKS